jgi:hypothetical protein
METSATQGEIEEVQRVDIAKDDEQKLVRKAQEICWGATTTRHGGC